MFNDIVVNSLKFLPLFACWEPKGENITRKKTALQYQLSTGANFHKYSVLCAHYIIKETFIKGPTVANCVVDKQNSLNE